MKQTSLSALLALILVAGLLAFLGRQILDLAARGFSLSEIGSGLAISLVAGAVACVIGFCFPA